MGTQLLFREHPDCSPVRVERGLGITGCSELFGRSLEAKLAQVSAERGVDLTEYALREGKRLGEILSHSRFLGALTGEKKYDVHRLKANDH
jgi:hypothetical protein